MESTILFVFIIVIALILVLFVLFLIIEHRKQKKYLIKQKQYEQRMAKLMIKAEDEVQKKLVTLKEKYGTLTHHIKLGTKDVIPNIRYHLLIFGEAELLYIDGQEVLFKDIISYNITNQRKVEYRETTYTSKTTTSTGSMLGRAVIGAAIGGGIGALIGASSASKKTTTIAVPQESTVINKYILQINVRKLECPVIKVKLGNSTKNAEDIKAIFTYIIDANDRCV